MADIQKSVELATKLLKDKGLYQIGWRVILTRSKRGSGICKYYSKQIGLSALVFPQLKEESAFNTVTHEIAHAIAGNKAGHGLEWQRIHRELGGNGQRLYTEKSFIDEKRPDKLIPWIGTCPNGHQHHKYRRPTKPVSCGECSRQFDKRYLISWKQNTI